MKRKYTVELWLDEADGPDLILQHFFATSDKRAQVRAKQIAVARGAESFLCDRFGTF